jgi:tetratricopeptide (TPR) repeat protein
MRWLTAGMAVMFLAAIVITVLALRERAKADRERARARSAETAAKDSAQTAQTLADRLLISAATLQKKNELLDDEKIAKGIEAKRADDRAKDALAAKKNAESEKAKAEQKTIEAGIAKTRAVASAEEAQSALARGELIKEGLEAARRQDTQHAHDAFETLATKLDEALRPAPAGRTLSKDEVEKFTKQLGWALSNLGSVQSDSGNAEATYERARAELEKVWPKPSHPTKAPERILFETYDGLANTYHDIALAGHKNSGRFSERIEPGDYYKKAEDIFQYALAFQERRMKSSQEMGITAWDQMSEAAGEVAAGHLNLARLYRDMGRFTETEKHLKELVEVRNEHGLREDKVAANRELAEFYRRQDRLAEAEQAYNDLIATQADSDSVEDYAKFGTDIANSYNELADVYRARAEADKKESQNIQAVDKTRKAAYALAAATAIQRFSSRLRRPGSSDRGDDRDDLADDVAESYFKLGQLDRAARLYEYALNIREQSTGADHAMLWKSYENLRKLYVSYKDRTKEEEHYELAEKYNKQLLDVLQDKPQSIPYADALTQLGNLYSLNPKRYSESEPYYDQALKIYQSAHDWMNENVVLFRLSKLYEKQGRGPEHEQALIKRVDTLAGYFNRLANRTGAPPKEPVQLVYEYIYATNALGFFYAGNAGRRVEAAAAYHKAFLAADYITRNIYNDTFLKFYAAVLADYQKVLNKLENKTEAAMVAKRVDDVTKAIQLQLNKLQQSEEISRKQTSQQDQQSQTRAP